VLNIKEIAVPNFEKVIEAKDPSTGLHCFIAIHNTSLGPAMGGTRIYPYASAQEAKEDALRLAKAMTYKSALAGNGLGGGKAVIIADPKTDKTKELLFSFAQVVDNLKGQYIAAEDVGSNTQDMLIIHQKTPYVGALPTDKSSGDPSRFTAWGVFQGMRAVAQKLWNHSSLKGKRIALQGLGNVGSKLANILFWEGADLILCDKDPQITYKHAVLYGGEACHYEEMMNCPCDIFAPCALGGILNDKTISHLRCAAVAGSANNQLEQPQYGEALMKKGILYAPDYVINAGGIINAAAEFDPEGYNPKMARNRVNHIFDVLLQIFEKSEREHKATNHIADELAEHNIAHQIGKRTQPIYFPSSQTGLVVLS
jgi:leucine dehydrogenase